jgi:hypothetical protein
VAARFTFASMVRRGFAADERAVIDVAVTVTGKPVLTRQVPVMTPGDVVGIPARQVLRCTPVNGLADAEPNFLATIELDAPDLPWLFSRAPASGPILPWITLAVIDVTELAADPLSASPVGTQLAIDAAQLPRPADAWMWAHAQLLDGDTVPGDPARSLSRLVSSRKLAPDRRYLACVVPVFASGRAAGLGLDPGDLRTSFELAWDPAGGDVTLPVYYSWRFGTGPAGDFEALVRRLHGVPLPPGLGRRTLRLDGPTSGLPTPAAGGAEVELQVALRRPEAKPAPIEPLVGASYLDALRSRLADAGYDTSLLDARPDAPPPAVGPPVYGQLAVGATGVAAALPTLAPPWMREVNLDPRLRVAAGLGGEVVRQHQDRYVEAAWRQVGDVLGANQLRRRAEYSLAASAKLHRTWIARLAAADLVTSTAPVHARVFVADDLTVTGQLRRSPLPPAIASVEYRRVTRARGRLSGATAWHAAVGPAALAARATTAQPLAVAIPLDTIDATEPPSRVWGAAAAPGILAKLVPGIELAGVTSNQAAAQLDAATQLATVELAAPGTAATHVGSIDPSLVLSAIAMEPIDPGADVDGDGGGGGGGGGGTRGPRRFTAHLPDALAHRLETAAPAILSTPAEPAAPTAFAASRLATLTPAVFGRVLDGTFEPPVRPVRTFTIATAALAQLKAQMAEVATTLVDRELVATDARPRPQIALAGGFAELRDRIVAALDPRTTLVRMVNHQIAALPAPAAERLDDIMAAPDLSEPTYQALAAISHDWLLPGIDTLPADTTTLVESNRTFISAFLVGMNHEMARELLWREYPTDQRGTYCRQFWNHRDTGDPADQDDLLHRLHESPQRTLEQLGERPDQPSSPLVLVVKGDLVRRYPGMLVTAAKTRSSGATRTLDPATELQPDFMARLEPDVLLVGFTALSAKLVRAEAGDDASAWWFFFAEHFTEPRFGLDLPAAEAPAALADWNDASWSHAAVDAAGRLGPASFAGPALPKTRPGTPPGPSYDWHGPSSSVAWILLQAPFRRGVRAADLLPPEPPP